MLTEETFALLKKTPPFSFLDDALLRTMAADTLMEFHPRGQTILHQDGPAADHLSIIRSGAGKVFVRTNEGEEVLVDYRAGGEFFGLLSLLYGGGDKLLFTNVLSDLAVKKVITAPEDATIQEAAEIMAEHKISSLVLLDPSGLPSGMITDRDLRNKVVSKGRDVGGRVGDIMSATIIKSEARDYCFEALLKMIRYNIHHLLVVSRGELKGILTSHDLMMLQGTSPLSVAREIEEQTTIDGLAPAAKKINKIIAVLITEGAKASTITRIITEINDRLLKKALEITESRLGPPPVGYCWIVYGSEGRKEQTFKTDQDNAIIYEDPEDGGEYAGEYFSEFALRMKDALARCGFPPCGADYMASNPKWRQPLGVWKKYFANWMAAPTPEAILQSLIFFDFRPVHGDLLLAEKLRAYLGHAIKDRNAFLAHMAGVVVRNRPPLGFFGNFSVEKSGPQEGKFDIKVNALCPIIDAARLSALELGVYQTSTLARITEAGGRRGTVSEFCGELEQAFEFLLSLRLRRQYEQLREGTEPDNFIDPRALGVMERRLLKEAFKLILSVQEKTRKKYGTLMTL